MKLQIPFRPMGSIAPKISPSVHEWELLKSATDKIILDPQADQKWLYLMWMRALPSYGAIGACPEFADSVYVIHTDTHFLFYDRQSGKAYTTTRDDLTMPVFVYSVQQEADGKYRTVAGSMEEANLITLAVCATPAEAKRELFFCAIDMTKSLGQLKQLSDSELLDLIGV